MTAPEKVLAVYPDAVARRYTMNDSRSYYLIWSDHRQTQRLGEGKQAYSAWVDAARWIAARARAKAKAEDAKGPPRP